MSKAISYGSLDMQTANIITTNIEYTSTPPKNLQSESLASEHGGVYVQELFRQRAITTEGVITYPTTEEFEIALDEIQGLLNKVQQNLDIAHAGQTRRYIATARNVAITRRPGLNSATFSIEFFCSNPFGTDTAITTLFNENSTAHSLSLNFTVEGSHLASPQITMDFSIITSGTGKTVSITNGVDFTGISITRNWSSGDVLVLDSANKTVTVNDIATDFNGRFPQFEPGLATVQYSDNFDAVSYNLLGEYYRQYV